ncbi:hypothetical protein FQY83_00260 [Luteimonas marina]|uniref:Uncharacterized protein n=1 Tax=Luteimonas marina TaxID=488485 RepID=A0A5C5UBW0_9GAMM|nr:hypothetical protein [Luteimonas marina]TWT23125.1 hypothetical protein FQY83_00260 [Luteimonas marina]
MPNSTRSSSASASSLRTSAPEARIEWRPSRWLLAAIAVLAVSAACAVLASEMPRGLAWPLAVAAVAHGARLFRRERRRPAQAFVLRGDAAPVQVDGEAVEGFDLQWRGPLAFASWRDGRGRRRRRAWWPDTLPPPRRRELRLAAPAPEAARGGASMAP